MGNGGKVLGKLNNCAVVASPLPPLTTPLSCVCGIFDINSFGQFYKRLSGLTCSSGIHIFH